jgi:hypothetical protein
MTVKVRVSTRQPTWPWLRQTPGSSGRWGQWEFAVDADLKECDYWVVYSGLEKTEQALCARENVIFFAGEPESITRYPPGFLRQFGRVVTCQRRIRHPRPMFTQQAQPWHVGWRQREGRNLEFRLDYDQLKAATFEKSKMLSVISSAKAHTRGHRQRLRFVSALQEAFGGAIDVFGRGLREIEDKWDAIAPYKYHVAIENSRFADYWTEKLADTYLGGAFPIYYGCPNVGDYFPPASFCAIDIGRPGEAIERIRECLAAGRYEASAAGLREARDLVLDRYNLFPAMAALCPPAAPDKAREVIELRPERDYWSAWQYVRYHALGPLKQRVRQSMGPLVRACRCL